MATEAAAGARAEVAHLRILKLIEEHGTPEAREKVGFFLTPGGVPPNAKEPWFLMAFQAEVTAALAQVIEDQGRRIAELEEAAKPASSRKK